MIERKVGKIEDRERPKKIRRENEERLVRER